MASNPTAKTMNFRFDTIPIYMYISQAKIRAWSGEVYVSSGVDMFNREWGAFGWFELVLEFMSGWLPAHH